MPSSTIVGSRVVALEAVMPKKSPSQEQAASTLPLADQAYAEIRRRILDGEYPAGTPLSEYQLSADLQYSRTPIREALRRIVASGLGTLITNRGVFVAELSAQDIAEVYHLRELLECYAIRLAASHISDAEIAALKAEQVRAEEFMRKGKDRDAYDMAVAMHDRIQAVANNSRLTRFLDALSDQSHRLGLITLRHKGQLELALSEHRRILEALEKRDPDLAEKRMREHLARDYETAMAAALPAGSRRRAA
ncbi:MAG: GntR family transcriptional regulator [Pseudomonadota bacterium]